MVEPSLTGAARALLRLAMRLMPIFPAAACAAALGAAASPPAWAESPVVIEGASEETREAILDLLPDRDRPQSLFDAERIAEEAANRANSWLRSEGYYAATVTPEAGDSPPMARLVIAPGPRFRFTAPTLVFDNAIPDTATETAVRDALEPLREGEPARAATILEVESAALAALQALGYADAAIGERRVVVDHATNTVAAAFHYDAGDLVRLGDVRAEPNDILRPRFVDHLRNWDRGDRYTPEALARLRRDLASTGAVSRVSTTLDPPDENGLRDVVLDIEPAARNAYELGLSYSTTEGAGLAAEWTRRNFTRRADALTIAATLAELQQDLTAELSRPHAAGLGHEVIYGAAIEREDLEAYRRTSAALYASIDASNNLRLGVSYGARLSADQFDDLAGGVTDAIVLSGFASVRRNTTGVLLDPRGGSRVEFRIEPSLSTGDETLVFARSIAEGRAYRSFGREDAFTLAARIRTGWLAAVTGSADDAPADRRFYAGGGGSVRGYEYNTIYPEERDALALTPGGEGLLEGAVELRWRSQGRWGAAVFVDGGTAFDDWSEATDLSYGVGFGVRYNLGFAPLRVDVAFPLDDDETADDFALYISLGQAF
jgi:translocation and assembly module TamA